MLPLQTLSLALSHEVAPELKRCQTIGDGQIMSWEGHTILPTTPGRAYKLLTDPAVLVRTLPGLLSLTPQGDHVYTATMVIHVGAITEHYEGELSLVNRLTDWAYELNIYGEGSSGFVDIAVTVSLFPISEGTDLYYQGIAHVGGRMAVIELRVLSGVARTLLSQFFLSMAIEAIKMNLRSC